MEVPVVNAGNGGEEAVEEEQENAENEVAQEPPANDLDIIDIIDLGNLGDDEANQQAQNQAADDGPNINILPNQVPDQQAAGNVARPQRPRIAPPPMAPPPRRPAAPADMALRDRAANRNNRQARAQAAALVSEPFAQKHFGFLFEWPLLLVQFLLSLAFLSYEIGQTLPKVEEYHLIVAQ